MEQEQGSSDENKPRQPFSEDGHEAGEDSRAPTIGVEFGHLRLIPPEGGSWAEWVIATGIAEAEREDRPIEDRVAHYIAVFLGSAANPALRNLATTGIIDGPGIQEELVGHFFRQTEQVKSWIDQLAEYCMHREDRGPIENWRRDIDRQDRAGGERVRRDRLFAELDDLFGQPVHDQLAGVEELGWFGLRRHDGRPGGWIVNEQAATGERDVFETDSDAELAERWRDITEHYLRFCRETRPVLRTLGNEHRDGEYVAAPADPELPEP
jgi:hypothetical protein